ncbi:hypothetical protein T492DRAFT_249749 [Pavlovales sp. CCMP2436]|nr:hypothetical protein T492DRAFT_249749 [Pavlovales sp. CCMP2436]
MLAKPADDDVPEAVDHGADGGLGGGFNGREAEEHLAHKWINVSHFLAYTPTADDVGRSLRLVCTPVSIDGNRFGLPKAIDTSIVIAAPPPPPARRRLLVRNDEVRPCLRASVPMCLCVHLCLRTFGCLCSCHSSSVPWRAYVCMCSVLLLLLCASLRLSRTACHPRYAV